MVGFSSAKNEIIIGTSFEDRSDHLCHEFVTNAHCHNLLVTCLCTRLLDPRKKLLQSLSTFVRRCEPNRSIYARLSVIGRPRRAVRRWKAFLISLRTAS